jgi:hypothetical protein
MASHRSQATNENFEKRRIPRFPVQLPVILAHHEDDSSICTNLSSKGVSVETAKQFHVSDMIFVEVTLAPGQQPLRMQGQVVWKKPMKVTNAAMEPLFELGIRFVRSLPTAWKIPGEHDPYSDPYGFDVDYDEEFPDFIPPHISI